MFKILSLKKSSFCLFSFFLAFCLTELRPANAAAPDGVYRRTDNKFDLKIRTSDGKHIKLELEGEDSKRCSYALCSTLLFKNNEAIDEYKDLPADRFNAVKEICNSKKSINICDVPSDFKLHFFKTKTGRRRILISRSDGKTIKPDLGDGIYRKVSNRVPKLIMDSI